MSTSASLQLLLQQQGFLVLDGGLASELEFLGLDLNDPLWSTKVLLEQPEAITSVHQSYLEAGADIITTATYQASYPGLTKRGLTKSAIDQLLIESVYLARSARDRFYQADSSSKKLKPLVAASVGPYGAFLADGAEYTGQYGVDKATLREFHATRLEQLAYAGPDLLALETIPCLAEAEVLIDLLRQFPNQAAYLSYSCRDGKYISSGETFKEAVAITKNTPQIVAVGINCTAPQWIKLLLESVQGISGLPFIVYPNRGETWDATNKCWVPGSEGAGITGWLDSWYELGAKIIGGCCRVRPADIQAIRQQLQTIQL